MFIDVIPPRQRVRFNRYIVECKYNIVFTIRFTILRFNRYIVECKSALVNAPALPAFDLIDT